MSLTSLIILIVLIVMAVVAIKFLMGAARTIVSIALFILAALLLIGLLTGRDPLGITALVTSFLP